MYSSVVNVYCMASSTISKGVLPMLDLALVSSPLSSGLARLTPLCRVAHGSSSIDLFPSTYEIQGWSCLGFVSPVEAVSSRRAKRWYHMGLLPLHLPSRALYQTPMSRHTRDVHHASRPSASSGPGHLGRSWSLALRIGRSARDLHMRRVPLRMVALLVSSLLVGHTT